MVYHTFGGTENLHLREAFWWWDVYSHGWIKQMRLSEDFI